MAIGNVIYTPRKALVPADVVDNLLSTAANLPLSANQGKILNDAVTQLNTDMATMPYNVTPDRGVNVLQFGIFDNAKLKNTYDEVPEFPMDGNYLLLVAYDTLHGEKTWCILAIPIDNTPMYIYNHIVKSWKQVSTVS